MSRNYKTIIFILIIGAGLLASYFYLNKQKNEEVEVKENIPSVQQETIGYSIEGRKIEAYTYGTGATKLLLVGGIHGGYEWNTVLLAKRFLNYFAQNLEAIPEDISVIIIPSANPDGLYKVTQKEGSFSAVDITTDKAILAEGRFNANGVDLNRNFACKWQPKSSWRGKTVSAGEKAFSELEAQAIRDFVLQENPTAVVFWHSQANTVYASECENGILPQTSAIMNLYAQAGDYATVASFDSYEITGDAEGWLASIGIPAITVELENHQSIDWERNLAGVKTLLQYFTQ